MTTAQDVREALLAAADLEVRAQEAEANALWLRECADKALAKAQAAQIAQAAQAARRRGLS